VEESLVRKNRLSQYQLSHNQQLRQLGSFKKTNEHPLIELGS